jgi:hypothetical protein
MSTLVPLIAVNWPTDVTPRFGVSSSKFSLKIVPAYKDVLANTSAAAATGNANLFIIIKTLLNILPGPASPLWIVVKKVGISGFCILC